MSDDDLRAVIDAAIQRHLASRRASDKVRAAAAEPARLARIAPVQMHASHAQFPVTDGEAKGGACVIEPAVTCVQSGHCRSRGH